LGGTGSASGSGDTFSVYQYGPNATASYGGDWTAQTQKTVYQGTDATGIVLEQDTYGYNLQGQMSSATVDQTGSGGSVTTSSYTYNDAGIRVSQTVNGTRTNYLIDDQNPTGYSQVLEEKDASGNVTTTYTLGLDIIAQQSPAVQSGGTLFLLKDGHGSTRGLVDATGQPLSGQVYRYDAFGNAIGFSPANALTSHLYNGETLDSATGLYNFRARMYDPATATFTTADSDIYGNTQDPQSLHKYVLCQGDPINGIDPTGHYIEDVHFYFTYYLARCLGLSGPANLPGNTGLDLAYEIAWMDEEVDHNAATRPNYNIWDRAIVDQNGRYHFPGYGPIVMMGDPAVSKLLYSAAGAKDVAEFGVLLHVFQDTFSHAGYGTILGHAYDLAYPDQPYNKPLVVPEMARACWNAMSYLANQLGATPPPQWQGKTFKDFLTHIDSVLFFNASVKGRAAEWRQLIEQEFGVTVNFVDPSNDPWLPTFLSCAQTVPQWNKPAASLADRMSGFYFAPVEVGGAGMSTDDF
jgi:RHS repeat-associated protein